MNLNPRATVVVFSGGQDSTTCLGWALERFDAVHCVSFDYGQRHAIELEAAERVVEFYRAKTVRAITHEIIKLGEGVFAGSSPLTNKDETLETYANHDEMEAIIGDRIEKTFVPMRNAVFLALAANRAIARGCASMVTGVCQADNANYPDCRESFIDSAADYVEQAIGLGIGEFAIHVPLMYLSKAESIALALKTPPAYAALAYSHTAYDGTYPPTSQDHASVLRAHGFVEANVPDPLVVRAWGEKLMSLPETANYDDMREGADPIENAGVLEVLENLGLLPDDEDEATFEQDLLPEAREI